MSGIGDSLGFLMMRHMHQVLFAYNLVGKMGADSIAWKPFDHVDWYAAVLQLAVGQKPEVVRRSAVPLNIATFPNIPSENGWETYSPWFGTAASLLSFAHNRF